MFVFVVILAGAFNTIRCNLSSCFFENPNRRLLQKSILLVKSGLIEVVSNLSNITHR